MAAVDTSTLIAYLQGSSGLDVEAFDHQLAAGQVVLPLAVLSEILSDPKLPAKHRAMILEWPCLDILPDYWIRTAATRAVLIERGLRARLADALIAQSCLDHDVALITRDHDFRHFEKWCGLKLAS